MLEGKRRWGRRRKSKIRGNRSLALGPAVWHGLQLVPGKLRTQYGFTSSTWDARSLADGWRRATSDEHDNDDDDDDDGGIGAGERAGCNGGASASNAVASNSASGWESSSALSFAPAFIANDGDDDDDEQERSERRVLWSAF